MHRTFRLAAAAVAVAALAAPVAPAFADPDPPCRFQWEPFVSTTPGFPVHVEVSRPSGVVC